MKMEELLKMDRSKLDYPDIVEMINEEGLNNITKKDMDKLMDELGVQVILNNNLHHIYTMKANEQTNNVIKRWTITVGIFTIINIILVGLQFIF